MAKNDHTIVGIADIVRGLLETEHDRLMRDHYDDDVTADCDGCRHAAIIARTLATVIVIGNVIGQGIES